jgi:hypothetical protein
MWTLIQTYCCQLGKTAWDCYGILPTSIYLDFGNFISYSCELVAFLHVQCVLLFCCPVDVSDSFSLVEAEKTHLAGSNMSQCILYIPLSSQHSSWFLTVFIPSVSHRGEQRGKMISKYEAAWGIEVKFVN